MTTPCQSCPLFRLTLEEPKREARRWLAKYHAFCKRMKRERECEHEKERGRA